MKRQHAYILLAAAALSLSGCAGGDDLKSLVQAKELSPAAAAELASMTFSSDAPVSVHGRVTTLFFAPPGSAGAIVVHTVDGTQKYAFSTAATPDLAKQGFSRFTLHPGEEITVTGVLASGGGKVKDLTAARADRITSGERTLFKR